jgi:predicted ribosomally synthesized peptide with nif11-like leader
VSEKGVAALLQRLESDQGFRERLEAAPTNEARKQMIEDAGFDVQPSDRSTALSMIGLQELSDADLEKIAGGVSTTAVATAAVGSASAVSAATAIAAIAGAFVI